MSLSASYPCQALFAHVCTNLQRYTLRRRVPGTLGVSVSDDQGWSRPPLPDVRCCTPSASGARAQYLFPAPPPLRPRDPGFVERR
jgi:hypothetical protein